jgi:hypothetical protein
MQIHTKLNNLLRLYIKYPFIALLTSISGGCRIALGPLKKEVSAVPISWTFDIEKLIAKIDVGPEDQGLYHFLLNKLDPALVTDAVVDNSIMALRNFPTNITPYGMLLLSDGVNEFIKDNFEIVVLKRIERYKTLPETNSPEEALARLAYLGISGAKCREPLAISEFHGKMSLGYRLLAFHCLECW